MRGRMMTVFKVKVDYDCGKWIKEHPRPIVEVLAANAKEAAEIACGTKLRSEGHATEYRAQVWP